MSSQTVSKRFSIVTETYPPEINGVANSLRHLVHGLLSKQHQLQVIRPRQHMREEDARCQEGIEHLVMPGLPIPGYPELKFGLPLASRLLASWQANPPDAIYVATQGPLGLIACNAARQLRIPVLTGFHTNFHQYSHYYHAGWLEPVISSYLRWFHNRTAGTLTPTEKMRSQLNHMGIHNPRKLSRGVDCQRFRPAARCETLRSVWKAAPSDPVILYAGRLAAEKNIALAIKTFKKIGAAHPRAKFVLVGDGPLRRELQEKHPALIFCGMQTGDVLAKHFASADIFLFPSKTDTFGNVVTEAMASGLGVVAFDDAAASEHIIDAYNGLKVPLGQDADYIAATLRLVMEPQTLSAIRQRAREKALSIQWAHIVDQFETLLLSAQPGDAPEGFFKNIPLLQPFG